MNKIFDAFKAPFSDDPAPGVSLRDVAMVYGGGALLLGFLLK